MDSETLITILTTAIAKAEDLEDEIAARVKRKNLRDILIHKSLGVRLQLRQAMEILIKGSWQIYINSVVYIDDKVIRKSLKKSFE